jgi:hypothetical protein
MHPVISHQLMQARVADLNTCARRTALTSAIRRSRRKLGHQAGHPAPGLQAAGRRLLSVSAA